MPDERIAFVSGTIDEIADLQKQQKQIETRIGVLKNQMLVFRNANTEIAEKNTLESASGKNKINFQTRLTVKFDVEKTSKKLKERGFSKTQIDEVCKKSYSIVDAKTFLKRLKDEGIPLDFVKKHVISSAEVDKTALQELFDLDVIALTDLEGCYTAKLTNVVTVKEI